MQRNSNQAIEWYFTSAEIKNFFIYIINLSKKEICYNVHIFALEEGAQHFGCLWFCKCARHWSYVSYIYLFAHTFAFKIRISQECEFQWSNRALYRIIRNIDDKVSSLPCFEEFFESFSSFYGIEIENIFIPQFGF